MPPLQQRESLPMKNAAADSGNNSAFIHNILSALENLAARNSRLREIYYILTNAYGIFWCYYFAKL